MGPFPTALRQLKFLVVGIDYFTKWVEAEPLATITEKSIRAFVWKNIVCRYGIPRVLVSDNGKQLQQRVQEFLLRARHSESLLITSTPAGKRTGRSHEQDTAEDH